MHLNYQIPMSLEKVVKTFLFLTIGTSELQHSQPSDFRTVAAVQKSDGWKCCSVPNIEKMST